MYKLISTSYLVNNKQMTVNEVNFFQVNLNNLTSNYINIYRPTLSYQNFALHQFNNIQLI